MVAVVDDNGPAPPELRLAWMCERWNSLPETGGLYDQDYVTLHLATALSNIYNTISRLRNMHGEQIHSLSDNDRKMLKWLMDEGLIFNA